MVEYIITSVDKIEDFDDIAQEHWNSFNNKQPKFNKDILKNFNVIQAKESNNTLGYILYILFKAPYYDEIWCQVDMFYLKPNMRKQGIGKSLFTLMEKEAKEKGASKILSSFNLKQPLEGFYKKLGYSQTHVAVAKEL